MKPTFLKHDTGHKDYFTISTKYNHIKTKWAEAIVNIIRADDWQTTYNDSVTYAKRQCLEQVNEFYATSYQNTKKILNVEWGYPANKPGYTQPTTARNKGADNGDFSYWRGATYVDPFAAQRNFE